MLRITLIANSANTQQRADISKILTSALAYLNEGWEVSTSGKANLALIWINSEHDWTNFSCLRDSFPLDRIIAISSSQFSVSAQWHLPFVQGTSMPSALSLANLLSRVHNHFKPGVQNPERTAPNLHEHLYGLTQQALHDLIPRIVKHSACPDLYLLPSEQAFYLDGPIDQLVPMALAKWRQLAVTEVESQQVLETVSYVKFSSRLSNYLALEEDTMFDNIKVKRYKRFSINELVWFSALIASQGKPLQDGLQATPVLLKQIPEYLRLDYYGKEFKPIADCMVANPLTLAEISQQSGCSLFEVMGFFNACSVMGWTEAGDVAKQAINRKTRARDALEMSFVKLGKELKGRIKIVVAGSIGSGKTTAIATLSDFSPITTETRPSDNVTRKKSTTTVAMDYGEIRFNKDLKVFLYGTPGQKRFDFMSQILCENAWGMLLLIDNSETDPLLELAYYLKLFDKFIGNIQLAIGVTHCDLAATPDIQAYVDFLNQNNLPFPVRPVDARELGSLTKLLDCLVEQAKPALAA